MARPASRAMLPLLLLAAAAMVLQLGSVPHLHVDDDVGVYNEEHDRTLLAGLSANVIEADVAPIATVDTASTSLALSEPPCRAFHVARPGEPRAPPPA